MIERKAKGKQIAQAEGGAARGAPDLMAALEASLEGTEGMPRSLWTGSLSFGLVNVPVTLFSAVRDHDLRFRQLHEKDARRSRRALLLRGGREVPLEEVGHGYELEEGKTGRRHRRGPRGGRAAQDAHDRHRGVRRPRGRRPDVLRPPVLPAPIGDSEGTLRAYQLLVEVMENTDRVALGRFVMRTKEYLVASGPATGGSR